MSICFTLEYVLHFWQPFTWKDLAPMLMDSIIFVTNFDKGIVLKWAGLHNFFFIIRIKNTSGCFECTKDLPFNFQSRTMNQEHVLLMSDIWLLPTEGES